MSARFQKFLTAWQKARKGKVAPYRGDLSVIDLLDSSRQILTIDMARKSPRVLFAGAVASKGFEEDPIGEELSTIMSPLLIDQVLADLETLKAGNIGRIGTIGYETPKVLATMHFIALPLMDQRGETSMAILYGILSEAVADRAVLFPLLAKANIWHTDPFTILAEKPRRKAG